MTALHRVKAYFGMVPADELDEYDGYDGGYESERYYDDRRRPADRYDRSYGASYDSRHDSGERRREFGAHRDRWDDRSDAEGDRYESDRHGGDRFERGEPARREGEAAGSHPPRPRASRDGREARDLDSLRLEVPQSRRDEGRRDESRRDEGHDEGHREEPEVETSRSSRGRSWATNTGPNHTSVRPTSVSGSRSAPSLTPIGTSPSGSPASVGAATRGALAVDTAPTEEKASAPEAEAGAPAEITSLQPTSYNEARVIGERYRDGIPVIMNLTDLDEVAAKRLVDFAAGLAFALRGSIEKVTNRVFLLSPPNVEVSAAERRKLAETSYTAST